jgi:hypothetical protein
MEGRGFVSVLGTIQYIHYTAYDIYRNASYPVNFKQNVKLIFATEHPLS